MNKTLFNRQYYSILLGITPFFFFYETDKFLIISEINYFTTYTFLGFLKSLNSILAKFPELTIIMKKNAIKNSKNNGCIRRYLDFE